MGPAVGYREAVYDLATNHELLEQTFRVLWQVLADQRVVAGQRCPLADLMGSCGSGLAFGFLWQSFCAVAEFCEQLLSARVFSKVFQQDASVSYTVAQLLLQVC